MIRPGEANSFWVIIQESLYIEYRDILRSACTVSHTLICCWKTSSGEKCFADTHSFRSRQNNAQTRSDSTDSASSSHNDARSIRKGVCHTSTINCPQTCKKRGQQLARPEWFNSMAFIPNIPCRAERKSKNAREKNEQEGICNVLLFRFRKEGKAIYGLLSNGHSLSKRAASKQYGAWFLFPMKK